MITFRVEIENDLNGPLIAVVEYDGDDVVNCEDGFSSKEKAQKRADELQLEANEDQDLWGV